MLSLLKDCRLMHQIWPEYKLKTASYLLQSGDGTSAKKSVEDLDILWTSKGGNVDLSKWSKDDFQFFSRVHFFSKR